MENIIYLFFKKMKTAALIGKLYIWVKKTTGQGTG